MSTFWLFIICTIVFAFNYIVVKRFGLKNVSYDIAFEEKVIVEGEKFHIKEKIYNGKLMLLPWVKSEFEISANLLMDTGKNFIVGDKLRYTSIFFLLPFQQIIRRHSFVATKRGFYTLDKVFLVTGDLFGIATNDRCYYFNSTMVVYPALIDLKKYVHPRSSLIGETIVKRFFMEDIFHFSGIREYQTNDPFNRINWNYTAKHTSLMVNKYEYTSSGDAIIILNVQTHEFERKKVLEPDKIEFGIKFAASLSKYLIENNMPVGFASNSINEETNAPLEVVSPSREAVQIIKIMETLARIKLEISSYIEVLFYQILRANAYKEVILITCFLNRELQAYIQDFKKRGIKFSVVLLDSNHKANLVEDDSISIYYAA